jgi:hypothetical protein
MTSTLVDTLHAELQKLHEEFVAQEPMWHFLPLHTRWLHRRVHRHHARSIDLTFQVTGHHGKYLFSFDPITQQRKPEIVVVRPCPSPEERRPNRKTLCYRTIDLETLSVEELLGLITAARGWWLTPGADRERRRVASRDAFVYLS